MRAAAFAGLLLLLAVPARAGDDIDRIPPLGDDKPADAAPDANRVVYLQNDVSLYARRTNLAVPLPPSPAASWEERLFADARLTFPLGNAVSFTYSGRLNFRADDDLPFPSHQNIRHDLREAYIAWQAGGGAFLEFGRINLKSGVALGYNPTDYFKTNAVVEPLSADPSVLREDRLGTLMFLAQKVWDGGALTLALAPKLQRPAAIGAPLPSFDPLFDRTNGRARVLLKASLTLFDDVNPEVLVYSEAGRTSFGLNLTRAFGQSVVGYLEWSGGSRAGLVQDAVASGAPPILPHDPARAFRSDLALGVSYAAPFETTFNLEYHCHQAGFSAADWRNWFDTGAAHAADPAVTGALWAIRGYASDRQEPLARGSLFARAAVQDAFVPDLALTAFVESDLRDGSGIAQVAADYDLSRRWSAGVLADATFGARRSDFGSLPGSLSVLARVSRYF
jgi:hypothetical protein